METQEVKAYLVDVAEEEPQGYHLYDAEHTQGDVWSMDKLRREDFPSQCREVEHIGSPEYRQQDRVETQSGNNDVMYEAEYPCLRNGLLVYLLSFAVLQHPSRQTRDCKDACQLHNPPDEHLHREKGIASPGTNRGGDEHA